MAVDTLKAEVTLHEGLKVECSSRGHSFILDQAKESGGNNEGMCPVEAMLSALGGCKSMVARMMSESLGIVLESFRIELEGEIDTNGFTGKDKNAKIGLSKIITNYYIKSSNSDEEVKNFVTKVEANCPVKDTIVNAPEMECNVNIV